MKKTGWELKDLTDLIQNGKTILEDYSKSYPLSAINQSKDRFVIIRKFAAREFEGKIDMLNLSDLEASQYYPISHFGMTLASELGASASSHNVILPNALKYERVSLEGETISIHYSDGVKTTNFKEINSLWTIENFAEKEILNRFNSLKNFIEEPTTVERHTANALEDHFFGQLNLNEELDWYEVTVGEIEYTFNNTSLEQLTKNLRKTENLLSLLDKIEARMIEEMLVLKNESWLEEGEAAVSKDEFQKAISIHSINIDEDGNAELYYMANDLFWGHEIQTSIDDEQNYESSTLVG